MANDLSKFRQNWLKELRQHRSQDQKRGTSASKNERNLAADADDKLQLPDDSAGRPCLQDHGADSNNQPVSPEQDQFIVNADNRLQVIQAQICDNQAESSATYYPFRILTTLLNRASTEEGPRCKRKRSSSGTLPDEKRVAPKRTYFSGSDSSEQEKDNTQKVKRDDVTCKQLEEEKDDKDYLDLFIADLVSKYVSHGYLPSIPSPTVKSRKKVYSFLFYFIFLRKHFS